MAYGLQVYSATGATVFDSEKVGVGSYVKTIGTVALGTGVTYGVDQFLMFKCSNFSATQSSGNKRWIVTKTTVSGSSFTTTFTNLSFTGGTIDYVIIDKISNAASPTDTYGLLCVVPDGSGAITTFDSRKFPDNPAFIVDGNNVFTSAFSHEAVIASVSSVPDALQDVYYSAAPLDYTNITSYVRKYGFLFENVGSGVAAYTSPLSSIYNVIGLGSGGGVHVCNELQTGSTYSHPNALQAYFYGRLEED